MLRDYRSTDIYREIREFCADVRKPGTGQISDCAQIDISPDGRLIAMAAVVADMAEGEPRTRLALTEVESGRCTIVSNGANNDRMPQFSCDGRIAFLSDRTKAEDFQLYLFDRTSSKVHSAPQIDGDIVSLQWSLDGRQIVVVGAIQPKDSTDLPSWLPRIEIAEPCDTVRRCWIYDVAADSLHMLDTGERTIWAAAWRDEATIALLASEKRDENGWFSAQLHLFDLASGSIRLAYAPQDQISPPVISPSGRYAAIVEGLCSDRGPVAGSLRLIDLQNGTWHALDTGDVDVLTIVWQSEEHLLISGSRSLEAVIGIYDLAETRFSEIWASVEQIASSIAPLERPGDCIIVTEGFLHAPRLSVLSDGAVRAIQSFDLGYEEALRTIATVEPLSWSSDDGLRIDGWLFRPTGNGPHPLILNIHGGPMQHWRSAFLARKMLHLPVLMRRGFAFFLPNPRGSTGRGQVFARKVLGDIGGADAADILAGVDMLITRCIADPRRIGVTGVSYGGFMTAWLATQTDRFSAAVSVSPHTNQFTAQYLSNVSDFMSRLIAGDMDNRNGNFFTRSPALRVNKAAPPTLSLCGLMDRCTPPEEAVQLHRALMDAGSRSALISYPHEGHGIRRLPAAIDCAARLTDWFIDHIQPQAEVLDCLSSDYLQTTASA